MEPVVELLRSGSAQVFLDEDHIKPGDQWQLVLEKSLDQASTLLVFWSRNAKRSEWVNKEWRQAADAGKRIIPVRLDDTDLPEPLAHYQYIDFRHFRKGAQWVPLLASISILSVIATAVLTAMRVLTPIVASRDSDGRNQVVLAEFWPILMAGGVALILIVLTALTWARKRRLVRNKSNVLAKDIATAVSVSKG